MYSPNTISSQTTPVALKAYLTTVSTPQLLETWRSLQNIRWSGTPKVLSTSPPSFMTVYHFLKLELRFRGCL